MTFYAMAMTEENMSFEISNPMANHPAARLTYLARGPRPPLPPVGITGSGLPIPMPRRYTPPVSGQRRSPTL